MCAMYQNQTRVCLEFLKSSGGCGKGREVKLNYSAQQVPLQLQGRVDEVGNVLVPDCVFPEAVLLLLQLIS